MSWREKDKSMNRFFDFVFTEAQFSKNALQVKRPDSGNLQFSLFAEDLLNTTSVTVLDPVFPILFYFLNFSMKYPR
jgi:hypothetical protein